MSLHSQATRNNARKNISARKFPIYRINKAALESFHLDLMESEQIYKSKQMNNFYFLICIDQISRYAFAEKIVKKAFKNIVEALSNILKKIR